MKKLNNLEQQVILKIYIKWIRQSFFCSDVAHSDGKYLAKITISDKILKERAYKIAKCKI